MNKKILFPIIAILILAAGIVAYFVLQKPALPQSQTDRCGDGVCQLIEKQKDFCPKDCEKKPEGTCKDLCGDGVCDSAEKANSDLCPKDCQTPIVSSEDSPFGIFGPYEWKLDS